MAKMPFWLSLHTGWTACGLPGSGTDQFAAGRAIRFAPRHIGYAPECANQSGVDAADWTAAAAHPSARAQPNSASGQSFARCAAPTPSIAFGAQPNSSSSTGAGLPVCSCAVTAPGFAWQPHSAHSRATHPKSGRIANIGFEREFPAKFARRHAGC